MLMFCFLVTSQINTFVHSHIGVDYMSVLQGIKATTVAYKKIVISAQDSFFPS